MKSLRVKAPGYNKLFTLKHQEIVPSQANDSKNIFHPLRGKASALSYFVSAKLVKCCTDSVREKNSWTVNGCSLHTAFYPSLNLYSQRALCLHKSCLESLLALWMLSLGHKTIYSWVFSFSKCTNFLMFISAQASFTFSPWVYYKRQTNIYQHSRRDLSWV